jgi:hypothetical protein
MSGEWVFTSKTAARLLRPFPKYLTVIAFRGAVVHSTESSTENGHIFEIIFIAAARLSNSETGRERDRAPGGFLHSRRKSCERFPKHAARRRPFLFSG